MTATGRSVEIVLLFTAFIASTYGFGVYLFPAMVEAVRVDIPFGYGTLGVLSGLGQAGFMVCALLSGLLTARLGAMPLILGSLILCGLCLGGLVLANSLVSMAVLLAILGGCAAAIWVPMVEVSRDLIPAEHQGKALGLMSAGTSYGVFLNSFLLTWLLPAHGWRSLWLVCFALVGLLAAVGLVRLRGLGGRSAALTEKPVAKPTLGMQVRSMPRGLTAAILAMMFLNGLSCMPFQTYLSAFVQGEAGLDPDTAAHLWRVIGLVGMVSGFAMGALADRITIRWAMVLTYGILAAACLLVLRGTAAGETGLLYAMALAFGTSFYAIFGLVPAYISRLFGAGSAALVFAFGNIALGLGGIVGNMLGGVLKEATGSFEPIYLVMVGGAVASALLSLFMPSERGYAARAELGEA